MPAVNCTIPIVMMLMLCVSLGSRGGDQEACLGFAEFCDARIIKHLPYSSEFADVPSPLQCILHYSGIQNVILLRSLQL